MPSNDCYIVNFIEVIVRSFTNCHINTKFTCIKDYNLSTHNFPITHRGIRFALAPFLIIVISQRIAGRSRSAIVGEAKNKSVDSFWFLSFFSSSQKNKIESIIIFLVSRGVRVQTSQQVFVGVCAFAIAGSNNNAFSLNEPTWKKW